MVSAAAESLPLDEGTAPGSMPSVARGHPALDEVWDVDVMSDALYRGRVFESLEQVWETSAGCGATKKSGPLSRWRACRPPHIGLNVKPEVLS